MASIKIELGKPNRDGAKPVYLRLTHKGGVRRERLPLKVTPADIGKKGGLTNKALVVAIAERKNDMLRRLVEVGLDAEQMTVDELYTAVSCDHTVSGFHLDYIAFGRERVRQMRADGRESTAVIYNTALNVFCRFLKTDSIDINQITKKLLLRYGEWFKAEGYGATSWRSYMAVMQAIHNKAKALYNDEDDTEQAIPRSPFAKIDFHRSRADERKIEKRALSAEAIRYIYNLPDSGQSRVDNAKDAFLLSFGLCGMNAIDMYEHEGMGDDWVVDYYRHKTARRSGEDSHIKVTVPRCMRRICEKRKGKRGKTWMWSNYYETLVSFNNSLNMGLKELVAYAVGYYGKSSDMLGLPKNLTFYAARHSWATIAANDCGISTDMVDRCLCHAVDSVAARSYIKKDWGKVDEANEKVMKFVFG